MVRFQDYTLLDEQPAISASVQLFTAKSHDGQHLLLKRCNKELSKALDRFKATLLLQQQLKITGISKPCETFEDEKYSYAVFPHDQSSQTLLETCDQNKLELAEKLILAINLCQLVHELHARKLILNSVNPDKIYLTPDLQVEIIDLSHAAKVSVISKKLSLGQLDKQQLVTISPEATGRVNRAVEQRSDLYSLGVCLYKLFTGHYPFESDDEMEMVHAHIARQPQPANDRNPELPQQIADILAKLLSKSPEQRYLSAQGLINDLSLCQLQLQKHNEIQTFPLDNNDFSDQINFSPKLYGREQEITTLLGAFAKTVKLKTKQLFVVSGYSGVGKSRLVQEVYKAVIEQQAYFITGKFEQYKKNKAYSALANALTDMVEQILGESESRLAEWQKALQQALGENAQLAIDFIPELEYIIGKQKPLAELLPTEAQTRFNLTIMNLFKALCGQERTIVLFLDDLQWSDFATVALLKQIIDHQDIENLFLVLSYRDNELSSTHALTKLLDEANHAPVPFTHLEIKPLQDNAVLSLITESLNISPEKAAPLIQIIVNKTAGNPFFTIEFVKSLKDKNILYRGHDNHWEWDISALQKLEITDNVVDLTTERLTRLPKQNREILHAAACIGNTAKIKVINHVLPMETEAFERALQVMVNDGIISVFSNSSNGDSLDYIKFSHDRVQQAAYLQNDLMAKDLVHYQIAEFYLELYDSHEADEFIFNYIEHLNLGASYYLKQKQQTMLVKRNLVAAKKAFESNAYLGSLYYFEQSEGFLPSDHWQQAYQLSYEITLGMAKALYLTQDYERANELFKHANVHITKTTHRLSIYNIQIQSLNAQNKMQDAMTLGVNILREVGVELPPESNPADYYLSIAQHYERKHISELISLPEMTATIDLLTLDVLNTMQTPAYLLGPEHFMKVAYASLELCFQSGISAQASKVFVTHALLLCGAFNQFEQGLKFAELAVQINDKHFSALRKIEVEFTKDVSVQHWSKHIRHSLKPLEHNFYQGIECGNYEYAFHSALFYCFYSFLAGTDLDKTNKIFIKFIQIMENKKQDYQLAYAQIWHQLLLNLRHGEDQPVTLIGSAFDESKQLPALLESQNVTTLFCFHFAKMTLAYLFDDLEQAEQQLAKAEAYSSCAVSLYHFGEFFFYAALVLAKICREQQDKNSESFQAKLKKIDDYHDLIKLWSEKGHENYQHKNLLIQAERQALANNANAWQSYDQAASMADKYQFPQHKALSYELAAKYWQRQGKQTLAQEYTQSAIKAYQEWGATAKAKQLKKQNLTAKKTPKQIIPGTEQEFTQVLDLASVLKASETLSGEVDLQEFLKQMMTIIMENAGAQRGALLFNNNEGVLSTEICISNINDSQADHQVPFSIINYVSRTLKAQILDNIQKDSRFASDPYFEKQLPKSILCIPSIVKGRLQGVVYLEHWDDNKAFSAERIDVIQLLADQTAISFENAKLYQQVLDYNKNLELQIHERTKELAAEKIKAEQANQAKSNFLANMSHEIRTPMNAVIGLTQLAQRTELSHTQKDYLNKIQDSSESLLGLINDILDFSKIEAQKMTLENIRFNLGKLLQRVVNVCTFKVHEKGLEFIVDIAPDVPRVLMGDPLRLQQIIVNLANNAVKFTEQGSIHIKISNLPDMDGKSQLEFSVIDSGIGMDRAQQTRLFQSFSQADESVTRKYGGTGLGLAICKQLTELMGGKIWVKSTKGIGSTFSFTALFERAALDEEHIFLSHKQALGKLKVLVADDINVARTVLLNALTQLGIKADGVNNGQEALEKVLLAEKEGRPYDLVLMDWKMPVMDGIESAARIQQEASGKLPHILMVSAYDKDEARRLAAQSGIKQFIEKPINQSTLIDALLGVLVKNEDNITLGDPNLDVSIPDLSNFSVLLVEDNMINQQVATAFLADTKITTDTAENGLAALNKLENQRYDLVLMDIQMPEMDGLTAAGKIRNELKLTELPIIAMTAHAMEGDAEKSVIAGMNEHLTKPIEPKTLYQVLAKYLKPLKTISEQSYQQSANEDSITAALSQDQLQQLKKYTGLSVDLAIKKMQGKPSLYLELIRDFWQNYQEKGEQATAFYHDGDFEHLYRIAHSLKSTAQYIGAYNLSDAARLLEEEINKQGLRVKFYLNEMTGHLDKLLTQLNRIYQVELKTSDDRAFELDSARAILSELKPLVQSADLDASDLSQQLYELSLETKYHKQINHIHSLINDFEFEDAHKALILLESELE